MKRFAEIKKRSVGFPVFGFTLVELIVVITILAILATIGFLSLSGYSQDAKSSAISANVRSIVTMISSESAVTNNSPRYYVVHDTWAALSGAIVYVDGNPIALTGGDWNAAGTNYSAGNPDYAKLKLNPEKFKISFFKSFERAFAAYDYKNISIGAMEASEASLNGRKRTTSYFQVAGIEPVSKKASVMGNFPTTLSGSVSGLIKDPSQTSATWSISDGAVLGTVTGCAPNCPVSVWTIAQLTYGVTAPTYAYSSTSRSSGKYAAFTNVGINQGKWYFELTLDDNYSSSTSALYDIGFTNKPNAYTGSVWFAEATTADNFWAYTHPNAGYFCTYTHCGTDMANTSGVISTFTSFWMNDVIWIAVDANAKTVKWYKNGILAWTTTGITTPTPWYVGISSSYAPSATGAKFNFGQSAFAYPVPSGYGSGVGTAAQ